MDSDMRTKMVLDRMAYERDPDALVAEVIIWNQMLV